MYEMKELMNLLSESGTVTKDNKRTPYMEK
jgi:hypothetical protein